MVPHIRIPLLLLASAWLPTADDHHSLNDHVVCEATSLAQSNVGLSVGVDAPTRTSLHSDSVSDPAAASDEAQSLRLRRSPTGPAAAAPAGDARQPLRLSSSGMSWLSSGVTSLVVVLGLIGVVFWMFRKAMPAARWRDGGALSVLARVATGPKQSIALVRVGRRRVLVVGLGGDRVSPLADIVGDEEVAELVAVPSASRATRGGFERDLREAVREGLADETVELAADEPARATLGQARSRLEALIRSLHPRTEPSSSAQPAAATSQA